MQSKTIYRLPKVIAKTGLSRSAIYELVADGQFPSQVHLGPRTVGWVKSEIEEWIDSRIDASRASELPATNDALRNSPSR